MFICRTQSETTITNLLLLSWQFSAKTFIDYWRWKHTKPTIKWRWNTNQKGRSNPFWGEISFIFFYRMIPSFFLSLYRPSGSPYFFFLGGSFFFIPVVLWCGFFFSLSPPFSYFFFFTSTQLPPFPLISFPPFPPFPLWFSFYQHPTATVSTNFVSTVSTVSTLVLSFLPLPCVLRRLIFWYLFFFFCCCFFLLLLLLHTPTRINKVIAAKIMNRR